MQGTWEEHAIPCNVGGGQDSIPKQSTMYSIGWPSAKTAHLREQAELRTYSIQKLFENTGRCDDWVDTEAL